MGTILRAVRISVSLVSRLAREVALRSTFGHLPSEEKARRLAAVANALKGGEMAPRAAAEAALDGLVLDHPRFLARFEALVAEGQHERALTYVRDVGLENWTSRARWGVSLAALAAFGALGGFVGWTLLR